MIMKKRLLTLHHQGCSGGTVISKAIASMLKTFVISEVHPDRVIHGFNPYDPIQNLLAQTNLRDDTRLKRDIFFQRINQCYEISLKVKINLVFRDHSHSDYMLEKDIKFIKNKSSLISLLSKSFNLISILTIRNPIESYISLCSNGRANSIKDFNDYCDRILLMTETYRTLGCEMIKYEDFCKNPKKTLKKICKIYEIEFNEKFEDIFYKIPMTGDSGRGKKLNSIQTLKPKLVDDNLKKQALSSQSYLKLCKDFNYDS